MVGALWWGRASHLMAGMSKVPLPPNSAKLGTKPLTHGSLSDIQDPNYGIVSPITHRNLECK